MIDNSIDALAWLHKQLETDDNEMVCSFAQELMSADADARCGAPTACESADSFDAKLPLELLRNCR